jgi:hypothetical protein
MTVDGMECERGRRENKSRGRPKTKWTKSMLKERGRKEGETEDGESVMTGL